MARQFRMMPKGSVSELVWEGGVSYTLSIPAVDVEPHAEELEQCLVHFVENAKDQQSSLSRITTKISRSDPKNDWVFQITLLFE